MKWINMKDRKPDDNQVVIFYFDITGVDCGIYQKVDIADGIGSETPIYGDCFISLTGFLTDDVTHWMPLPKPPTTKDNGNE